MSRSEDFEHVKRTYIFKTMLHLKALEKLDANDLQNQRIKAEVALGQVESSTRFMDLCVFILSLKEDV